MLKDVILAIGIFGFVLLILNVVFIGVIFFMRRKMAAVSRWHSIMGTVDTSYLERRSSGNHGSTNYPVVQYSYQVAGRVYQSSQLALGPAVGGSGAGKVIAKYPAGVQVMVFYDPKNPSDAVLEKRAPAQWLIWLILGIFDFMFCAALPIAWYLTR